MGVRAGLYDSRAEIYDSLMSLVGTAPTLRKLIRRLCAGLPERPRVLDLGCGTGLASGVILKIRPRAVVSGLDSSEEMLARYARKFPGALAYSGDFNDESTVRSFPGRRRIRLRSGSYDLVISTAAVSEYGDLKRVVPLMHRLIRPGGLLIVVGIKDNLVNKLSSHFWKFKPLSERRLIRGLEGAGFSEIDVISIPTILFPTNYLKYAVKARRRVPGGGGGARQSRLSTR